MISYSKIFTIGPRGSGVTTALVYACKSIDATLLCANRIHQKSLKDLGIKTGIVDSNLQGTKGPYIVDHYAMLHICLEYEDRIRELKEKIR